MAKTKVRTKPAAQEEAELDESEEFEDEDLEEGYEDEDESEEASVTPSTISDSRLRRKRKRGEFVETASVAVTDKKNRATPSARSLRTKTPQQTSPVRRIPILGNLVMGLVNYFKGVAAEMQKVTWPSREDTFRLTRMVIYVTVTFSIALGAIDIFYAWWFRQALTDEMIFLGVAAAFTVVAGFLTWLVFYRNNNTLQY